MPISDYLEIKITDHCLGKTAFTMPATLYVALYTADPGDANGGVEVSGTNYARIAMAPGDWSVPTATSLASNVNPLTFATAGDAWGTVTHVGILDAPTGGNLFWYGALDNPRVVATGDTVEWGAGALNVGFQ